MYLLWVSAEGICRFLTYLFAVFSKRSLDIRKLQGHPTTVFCKISAVRRSNYCLEFSLDSLKSVFNIFRRKPPLGAPETKKARINRKLR